MYYNGDIISVTLVLNNIMELNVGLINIIEGKNQHINHKSNHSRVEFILTTLLIVIATIIS